MRSRRSSAASSSAFSTTPSASSSFLRLRSTRSSSRTFGIDADEATFLAEPSPVRKWMEGKYAFKMKEDLNCNAIDAKYLSVDGRYVARNGPGPRFVVVARK